MIKKLTLIILIMIILGAPLTLSSCSFLESQVPMPDFAIAHSFENDDWLVIEDRLINKATGTVYWLELNRNTTILESGQISHNNANIYNYEFEESSLNQYTFLQVYVSGNYYEYYECVITYNYEGKEISRSYISEPLTREEMQKRHREKIREVDAFEFHVYKTGNSYIHDRFNSIAKENADYQGQMILNYAEDIFKAESDGDYYTVYGLAKAFENEIWFSTAGSDKRDDLRGEPLINGIKDAKITVLDTKTGQFNTVFECDKAKTQIVDFDKTGAYLLDSSGRLSYVDFTTENQILIHQFPDLSNRIDHITVTDKYIYVDYKLNGHTYFVYEKGGVVIANDSTLD